MPNCHSIFVDSAKEMETNYMFFVTGCLSAMCVMCSYNTGSSLEFFCTFTCTTQILLQTTITSHDKGVQLEKHSKKLRDLTRPSNCPEFNPKSKKRMKHIWHISIKLSPPPYSFKRFQLNIASCFLLL